MMYKKCTNNMKESFLISRSYADAWRGYWEPYSEVGCRGELSWEARGTLLDQGNDTFEMLLASRREPYILKTVSLSACLIRRPLF